MKHKFFLSISNTLNKKCDFTCLNLYKSIHEKYNNNEKEKKYIFFGKWWSFLLNEHISYKITWMWSIKWNTKCGIEDIHSNKFLWYKSNKRKNNVLIININYLFLRKYINWIYFDLMNYI